MQNAKRVVRGLRTRNERCIELGAMQRRPGPMTLNEQQKVMTDQRLIGIGWIKWGMTDDRLAYRTLGFWNGVPGAAYPPPLPQGRLSL